MDKGDGCYDSRWTYKALRQSALWKETFNRHKSRARLCDYFNTLHRKTQDWNTSSQRKRRKPNLLNSVDGSERFLVSYPHTYLSSAQDLRPQFTFSKPVRKVICPPNSYKKGMCASNLAKVQRYLNAEDYVGGFEMEEVEHILSDIESDFQTWAQGFAPLLIGTDDSVSIEKFRTSLQRMRPEIALAVAQTIFLSDLRDAVESVEAPCTIIQGTNDVVVPVSVGRYMQSKMKGHTSLEIMETDGHIPQLTAHQLLIEVLDKILKPNT